MPKLIVEYNYHWKKLTFDCTSYTPERMIEIAFDEWANGSVLYQTLWNFSNGRYSPDNEGQKIVWKSVWNENEAKYVQWYKILSFEEGEQKDYFLYSDWEKIVWEPEI
tara:strand:+ start:451 stop:774 length:324 start_codon:yes stop_codon:yes gene_type:complete